MNKPKPYDANEVEEKWKKYWEKEKIYKFNPKSKKKIYSIDTPPPTVSGKMHIGHAFQYSQMDFIARFMRMRGFELFYPFGTDDNGLPTERLVEKSKGIKAKDFSRKEFIKICLDYLKIELPNFVKGWKDIGISCDYNLYYSTIDNHSRKISQWSFLDLYKKGRLERRESPSMWCPECRTGIAQVEVKDKEVDSTFNNIIFKVDGKDLEIATTRPELLPACVGVFYHPDDKRYNKLKGKKAKVPLFDFEVPIIEDKRPDPGKGTGIVMCCTFGDQTDMEWQKAYQLPIKQVLDKDGRMTELAGKFKGQKIKEARKNILEELKEKGLLKSQKPIKHFVNVHERCGTTIEFIKSKQWFVKYLDLKKDMLKWGRQLNWYPDFMRGRYDNWVRGLQWDWLISNQRYYGVSFPVWYCEKCDEVILADESQLPVDPLKDKPKSKCKCGGNLIGEKDILNTWFTSSLTPLIALSLVYKDAKKYIPMDLRPQAHDIITFWLFNTVVKQNLHFNKNPFKDVIISGFAKLEGEKMSKSKGNIIEPEEVRNKFGADALRFWAASSKLGHDIDYQEKIAVTGKKFVNKLLNASRFVFMNLEDWDGKKPKQFEVVDEKFLIELDRVIYLTTSYFEKYEYSRARFNVEEFFWKFFTDFYLEFVKKRVYQGKGEEKKSAQYTLYQSLLAILKMISPIMPFVTEEIYQTYFRKFEKDKSIHISEWPKHDFIKRIGKWDDEKIKSHANELTLFSALLTQVRAEKTKAQKPMNAECLITVSEIQYKDLKLVLEDFKNVTNAKEIKIGKFKVEFI